MDSKRLLLVEDHLDSAQVLSRILSRLGYQVAVADSYNSAMTTAHASRFDLVLCDIGLPDGDGCDLLRELRRLYRLDGVALTGWLMPDELLRVKEAGFLSHVAKPTTMELLKTALDEALRFT